MFKRPQKQDTAPTITNEERYRNLERELNELKRLNSEYRALIVTTQDAYTQVNDVLRDLERNISHLTRPTVQALIGLEIETLATLPLDLTEQVPGAAEELQRFVHRPATDYLSPGNAAAELLKYRLHTVLQMLSKIIQGENVGPSDVNYQGTHDLQVLNNHERRRHEQRIEERRRNPGTHTDR